MERMRRIELPLSVWKTEVLPLNDIRTVVPRGLEPPARKARANQWSALAKRQVRATGNARRLAPPHLGVGGSSGIGGGCGSPNAASAADIAP